MNSSPTADRELAQRAYQAAVNLGQQWQAPADSDLGAFLRQQPIPAEPLQHLPQQWPGLLQRYQQRRQQRSVRERRWAGLALLVLALGLLWRGPALTHDPLADPLARDPALAASTSNDNTALLGLMNLSQQLEQEWQALQQRPRALSGAQVQRRLQLSHLIATVDAQLGYEQNDPELQRRLWQQRVVLMNELVTTDIPISAWQQTVSL